MKLFRGFDGSDKEFSLHLPSTVMPVTSNGIVRYNHRLKMNAHCTANLKMWPFDSYTCLFLIGSPIYSGKLVNYSFTDKSSHVSNL